MWCTNTVIQTVIGLINRHNETTNVKPKTATSGNQQLHPVFQVLHTCPL